MRVAIGCPLHGKEDILERYFDHLSKINYSDKLYVFIVNNPSERLLNILSNFAQDNEIISILDNTKISYSQRNSLRYDSLVYYRNKLLDEAFKRASYLLSIDADVLAPPDIIQTLLAYKKDIVGALTYVDLPWNANKPYEKRYFNVMEYIGNNKYKHYVNPPENKLFEVGLVGGIYLLSKKIYDSGARYSYHSQGEDCGFYNTIREKGFKIYCNGQLVEHLM